MAKPKPEPKRAWSKSNNKVTCYKSSLATCIVIRGGLWEAEEPTEFHDAELVDATKKINAILTRVVKNNKDPQRNLSFIEFQNRHFLVWSRCDAVSPYDDDATIIKALKLKVK